METIVEWEIVWCEDTGRPGPNPGQHMIDLLVMWTHNGRSGLRRSEHAMTVPEFEELKRVRMPR